MATEPNIVVEVAWTDNYAEPNPVWTDISDYVQGFTTSLGRNTEIGSVEAGQVNLVLDNTSGAFTPGNANSPFYPNVKPRRQVRVRVDDGTVPSFGGPVLVNEVLNPNLQGDNVGCGITFNSGTRDTFSLSQTSGIGFYMFDGDGGFTAHSGTKFSDGIVPFPVQPGDRVSASVMAQRVNPPVGAVTMVIRFYDSTGATLASHGPGTTNFTTDPLTLTFENSVAPAGATGCALVVGTSGGVANNYALIYKPALYIHKQASFDWSTVGESNAIWFDGTSPATDYLNFGWEGTPDGSRSLAYPKPNRSAILGRGYVERWPTQFDGLTANVTVPINDWLSDFGTKPLTRPLEYEYLLRNPADFFMFNDGSDSTEFPSRINPTVKATNLLAYPNKGTNLYSLSGNAVPSIKGGNGTLLVDGLPNFDSARTYDQSEYTDGTGAKYYIGVCLEIPIPQINCATDSFSFAFIWKLYQRLFSGSLTHFEPHAFTLTRKMQRYGGGSDITIFSETDLSGSNKYLRIGVRDDNGNRYSEAYGNMLEGDTKLIGLSWDAVNEQLRFYHDGIVGALIGSVLPDAGGTAVDVNSIIKTARFDRVVVMGYVDPVDAGGFADQAMQFFARWDKCLTLAEFSGFGRAVDGLGDQAANDRVNYILDQINWPRELRRIDTSSLKVPFAGWDDGTDALQWLRSTAETTLNSFYVDRDGAVTFADHLNRPRKTTADWVFDHDAGTGVESGLTFEAAEGDIVNVADIDNAFGIKTTIRNQASVDEFGEKRQSYSLRLANDDSAIQYGYHMVNRYGDAIIRISGVTLNPSAQADGLLWDAATKIAFGDRVKLKGLPDTAPATEMDFYVESVAHDVTRDGDRLKWTVSLSLSPAEVWAGWILGDPTYGVLGQTTRLIF